MADDSYYSSNKRKFDDQGVAPPPSIRRATGFSAPIVSPPPASAAPQSDVEFARQKALEVAARLFNTAEANRVKSENGDYPPHANDYTQKPVGQPIQSQYGATPPSSTPSYGYQSSSKKIEIPNGRVGAIIGKGGETIKYLQATSGAKIQVTRDMDADPYSQTRHVEIIGTSDQVSRAEQLINDVLSEADAGGSGILAARKVGNTPYGAEQFVMKVPNNKVGLVIGKGGETIKNMQANSGARIQVIPLHLPPGDTSLERTVQIDGTSAQIEAAKQLVNEVISGENRSRNQPMSGGYSQQSYQQPPRPPMWGPPGAPPQMQLQQQVNYNYAQQAYPQYGGYPSTYPDQSSNQTTQQTGYDYYGAPQQQQLPVGASAAPSDNNSSYSYDASQVYGDPTAYAQQTYAYPPQDGSTTTTAAQGSGTTQAPPAQQAPPATQQGYNGQQQGTAPGGTAYATQAAYYGQPPPQAGYGYAAPPPPSGYGPGPAYGTVPTQSQAGYNVGYAQNTAAYSTDSAPSASPAVPKASPQG